MAQYVQCKKCQAPVGKYETPCPKCGADRRSARTAEPVRRFEYPCTEVQHIPCFYRELEYLSRMDEHSRETHAFHTLLQCCLVAESNQQLFEAALKLATLFDAPVRVLVVDSPRNKILPTVREGPLAALDAELKLTSVDGGIDAHGERLILLITDILLLDDQWEQRDCFRIMREDGRERQPRDRKSVV